MLKEKRDWLQDKMLAFGMLPFGFAIYPPPPISATCCKLDTEFAAVQAEAQGLASLPGLRLPSAAANSMSSLRQVAETGGGGDSAYPKGSISKARILSASPASPGGPCTARRFSSSPPSRIAAVRKRVTQPVTQPLVLLLDSNNEWLLQVDK